MLKPEYDLTGGRFTRLVVQRMELSKTKWRAICQCDCGSTITVRGTDLRREYVRSCGCLKQEQTGLRSRKDYTAQRFGCLIVEGMEWEQQAGYALCRCDCGVAVRVLASHLPSGHTQSCGCLRNHGHRKDLTGMRFGRLLVEAMAWEQGRGRATCVCDCGRSYVRVNANNLQQGDTRSCGCLKYRTPEEKYATQRLKAHRRLARVKGLPYTFARAHEVFMQEWWASCCAICGAEADFWHRIAWDHWIPLNNPACPGTVPHNILPLCHGRKGAGTLPGPRSCNQSKFQKDPIAWVAQRLGVRKAKVKLRQIEGYFTAALVYASGLSAEQALLEIEAQQQPLMATPAPAFPPSRNGNARPAA